MLGMIFNCTYENLPETVMKCWLFGEPWAAWTTATWAVTCWPFWFWPLDDVSDSETRICESTESEDSKGNTSITLTLPEGAVWRIIFFWRIILTLKKVQLLHNNYYTWLRLTWCKETGVDEFAEFEGVMDVLSSELSLLATDVTVMKFLANRVAIFPEWIICNFLQISLV